jgi:hypothetical protein
MQYADALSGLVKLEEVYLGLPEFISPSIDIESFCRIVLERNPSLKIIGAQCLYEADEDFDGGLWWGSRRVQKTQEGDISLRYHVVGLAAPRSCWDKHDF